jgi:hypothetical protein
MRLALKSSLLLGTALWVNWLKRQAQAMATAWLLIRYIWRVVGVQLILNSASGITGPAGPLACHII